MVPSESLIWIPKLIGSPNVSFHKKKKEYQMFFSFIRRKINTCFSKKKTCSLIYAE